MARRSDAPRGREKPLILEGDGPAPALGIRDLGIGLRQHRWKAVDIVQASLDRGRELQATINAFVEFETETALAAAERADEELARGQDRGALHGIPLGIKDMIAVAGTHMRAGSVVYDVLSAGDASIVAQLRQAGAIILGRTRMHEVAFGASGVNDHDGGVLNPVLADRIPGGSSSGSAAAVGSGICPGAVGTDTGGSVRVPAAFCGIVGFKPSYGLVSADGVMPLSPSLDHLGFLSRTVEDVSFLVEAASGAGGLARDATLPRRVAVLSDARQDTDDQVAAAFRRALELLQEEGVRVNEIVIGDPEVVMKISSTIMFFEAYRVHRTKLDGETENFGADVRARLREGASIPVQEYEAALAYREELRRRATEILDNIDCVISPTTPFGPPTFEDVKQPAVRGALVRNTRLHNVLGFPSLTIPMPTQESAVPVGFQVAALSGRDKGVLQFGLGIESLFARGSW